MVYKELCTFDTKGMVIFMTYISWTSSTINSFFKNSLGNKSSVFDGLYSSLGDSSLIKSGTYGKLMKSYYSTVKENKTDSTDSSDKKASSETTTKPDVLDQLLSKDFQKTKISNTYLDDLLNKNYTSDGTKNTSCEAAASIDTQV